LTEELFIGIDLGRSGVRVEVYDILGNLIAEGREPLSKQTIDEWLLALAKAMPSAVKRCRDCKKYVAIDGTLGTF